MNPFLTYLIKATLVSGVMYGYYYRFLRDNRFHRWNRFYLLSSVMLSLVLPLVLIPLRPSTADHHLLYDVLNALGRASGDAQSTRVAGPEAVAFWTWGRILGAAYALIVLVLALPFCAELLRVARLYHMGLRHRLEQVTLVETPDRSAPFSFFHWVFWNPAVDPDSPRGRQILRHELTHVRQGHTWDLILLRLAGILFFPILFFRPIRRELQVIHEFLADQNAAAGGDSLDYAGLLIQEALGATEFSFTHHFYKHPLQRRIAMISKFSLPSFTYLRKVMLLPLALVLFTLLAFRIQDEKRPIHTFIRPMFAAAPDSVPGSALDDSVLIVIDGKVQGRLTARQMLRDLNPKEILSIDVLKDEAAIRRYGDQGRYGVIEIITKHAGPELIDKVKIQNADRQDVVFTKVEEEAQFPGGVEAWTRFVRNFIDKNLAELQKDGKTGTCLLQFVVSRDGTVHDVQALTMAGSKLADVCIDAVRNGPNWVPAMQDGMAVNAFRRQKITFEMPTNN